MFNNMLMKNLRRQSLVILMKGFFIGQVWLVLIIQAINFGFAKTDNLTSKEIEIKWGVKIPLRDGVKLNATIYQPYPLKEKLPVVFTLTPYNSDTYHERGWYFARQGYIFVLVDVRGRGNSEGDFTPMFQEAKDGHDVVEWFGSQSWCDGQVAMWGGSYAGTDQWMTAKEFPPNLATIVPVASAFMGVDVPIRGNITSPYWIQWMTLTSNNIANFNLFGESDYWRSVYYRMYKNHLPYAELPKLANNTTTQFNVWMGHPQQDEFWDKHNPTDDDFRNFKIPILTITGHYDGDQPGAMGYYRKHMKLGSKKGRENHYLIAGPWDHSGTRTPKRYVGGVDLGKESLLDINGLHKAWYDWTMKNGAKPEFLKSSIAYYVMGSNEWKYIDSLDDLTTNVKRLYLGSNGDANNVFNSGSLIMDMNSKSSDESDSYVYDPLDTKPGELEFNSSSPDYLLDQTSVLALNGDGLIYHSEPFETNVEISGYLQFIAWISMDVPDTDFIVQVYEILPNGKSIFLTDDLLRARYRSSLRSARLVDQNKILKYEFDGFMFFSRQIQKGSRLRLVFTSPNSINLQKNYNSGGVVAKESSADARTANITLYHSKKYPSYLELPIIR
jgi:hypothetical protein